MITFPDRSVGAKTSRSAVNRPTSGVQTRQLSMAACTSSRGSPLPLRKRGGAARIDAS